MKKSSIFAKNKMKEALRKEIDRFCKVNGVKNVDKFIEDLIIESFTRLKYGDKPFVISQNENDEISEKHKDLNEVTITNFKLQDNLDKKTDTEGKNLNDGLKIIKNKKINIIKHD